MDAKTNRSIKETMTKHLTHFKDALVKGFGPEGPSAPQLLDSGKIVVAGVLRKLRDETRIRMASWHLIYAIVDDERLYYYEDETSEQPLGLISLRGCNQVRRIDKCSGSSNSAFAVCRPARQGRSREYTFATLSYAELTGWMNKIKDAMTIVNKEKVEGAVLQAVVSKPKDSIPRRRQPTPPQSDNESELRGIEEPLYQDVDSSESEEPAQSDNDCDTDGSDKTDYLPPAAAPGPKIKDTSTAPKVSEIKQDTSASQNNSRLPGGVCVFPPPLKPHVLPKPPSSKWSTLPPPTTQKTSDISTWGSEGATKTFARSKNFSKAPPPGAETAAAPRIYWSGVAEEAISALKECVDRGTYLIRKSNSDEPSLTLVVYVDDVSRLRKVKLCECRGTAGQPSTWYIRQPNSGQCFSSLEELVKHYSSTPLNLNETMVRLTKPLQHHMMASSLPPH